MLLWLTDQDLRNRPGFVHPFLIACSTHTTRFAASGISCLQRLIVSGGLPRARLQDTLQAFNTCADLGLDVQLKILQALPSLIQNYVTDLEGDLLAIALQLCASLQASKTATVSGVAAATLQSLVTTVFEKVVTEDQAADDEAPTVEVPGGDEAIQLKPAAFDAYRVFRDLALAADERPTKFVGFQQCLPSLELLWSSIHSNPDLFARHDELLSIIGANVWPMIIRALSERLSFSVTVRSVRLLSLLLDRHLSRFSEDCEVALNLCTQALEYDYATSWKRALVLEVLRDFFSNGGLVVEAYMAFDMQEGGKPVVQDMLSAFVRLSTEKPAAIGLGQQSSVPTGPTSPGQSATDHAALEAAGGMAGVISFGASFGVAEASIAGVSAQWSLPRTLVLEQLDKHDPPTLAETYPYALILECLSGLSDSLAKIVLPLTVQHEKRRPKSSSTSTESSGVAQGRKRSTSFRTRAVPMNPLDAKDAPFAGRVSAVASIVDNSWPAVLATASTFLNAALDDTYFRNLIKAYQRFVQVAGVLRLSTPRDALMTTLAKAAIPPHVLNAAIMEPVKSPVAESPRIFSNPKNASIVETLVSPSSSLPMDASRRSSMENVKPMLTVRNLLCLRALLNIAIALGPTLQGAFAVIVSALKQADMVLSTTTPQQLTRQSSFSAHGSTDNATIVQAFSAEVANVEKAASNLLESTSDYPNEAFIHVLATFCKLLHSSGEGFSSPASSTPDQQPAPARRPLSNRRTFSGLPGISAVVEMRSRDYHFVLPKLGKLAELNVSRFTSDSPSESGWNLLAEELATVAKNNDVPRDARRSATHVLVKLAEATIAELVREEPEDRVDVQRRGLSMLLRIIDEIYLEDGDLSQTDLEVQSFVFESLHAILERHGELLVAGWNLVLAIISSAFEHDGVQSRATENDEVTIDWMHISFELVTPQIGRTAFDATQLLCSDFLDLLPIDTVTSLIELLHRFMCQFADLNASLTAVTMTLAVSDHLFAKSTAAELDAFVHTATDFDDLEDEMKPMLRTCRPAQWLMLLIRLRDVAVQPQHEIRNATFQTMCGVLKSHGDELSPSAWDLLLRSTLLHVSRADSYSYVELADRREAEGSSPAPDIAMSRTIISGTSGVIAQHLRLIEQVKKLPSLWEVFLSMLERYLDVEDYILNATVYSSLAQVLSGILPSATLWKSPIYRTISLWLKRVPQFEDGPHVAKIKSNQDAFIAYAEAGTELYRLTFDSLSISQARILIDNMFHIVKNSDGPLYGGDTNTMSPLQSKVFALLKSMKLESPSLPACLITVAAKFTTLHHHTAGSRASGKQGPTFIALSHEAIAWLEQLIMPMFSDPEVFESNALTLTLQALRQIAEAKYSVKAEQKGVPLWQRATTAALTIAAPALQRVDEVDDTIRSQVLHLIGIINAIISSDSLPHMQDAQKIYDDQLFDINSFQKMRDVLVPRLGNPLFPDDFRLSYVYQLYRASIIHPPEDCDSLEAGQPPLKDISKIRRGRVKKVAYSQREDMAYVCWKELQALASPQHKTSDEDAPPDTLAQVATPFLIRRLAMPIRAYIADQPLRGKRPQPLSELEELLFSFECIQTLKLPPHALAAELKEGGIQRSFAQPHLHFLYPLLVQAVSTASDKWSGADEVLVPLHSLLASIGFGEL